MTCAECGAVAEDDAKGWRAYQTDLTAEAEPEDSTAGDASPLAFYCPRCAAREFGDRE